MTISSFPFIRFSSFLSSSDTFSELRLEFSSKDHAINYAKKKKIDYEIIEPKKRRIIKKSYAENFLK